MYYGYTGTPVYRIAVLKDSWEVYSVVTRFRADGSSTMFRNSCGHFPTPEAASAALQKLKESSK